MAAEERGISGVGLVTGCACGIGFKIVRQLAQRGMTVILRARDRTIGEAAAQEPVGEGLDVRAGSIDVTDDEGVKKLAAEVGEEFGTLDVLVNNAAVFAAWSETVAAADLESPLARSSTRICSAPGGSSRRIERSGHGRIVNASSRAGSHGEPLPW